MRAVLSPPRPPALRGGFNAVALTHQAAPGMAQSAENEAGKRMQSHAPYRCMAFFSKNGRIFGEFYTD